MTIYTVSYYPNCSTSSLSFAILLRMAANNSSDTAASDIWKIMYRAWQKTMALILITFSCNVVIVQYRALFGSAVWRKKFPSLYDNLLSSLYCYLSSRISFKFCACLA